MKAIKASVTNALPLEATIPTCDNSGAKILEVTSIKCKHSSDKEFIDIILKDYNYYTQSM